MQLSVAPNTSESSFNNAAPVVRQRPSGWIFTHNTSNPKSSTVSKATSRLSGSRSREQERSSLAVVASFVAFISPPVGSIKGSK